MRLLATIVACAAALCGCTTSVRSYMTEIRGGEWSQPVTVVLANSDTLGLYDFGIALRHDGELCGRTVEMTVRTVTPDSLWVEEPLSLYIGDDGRSRPAQHETVGIYRRSVRLASGGDYRITIAPKRPVQGVTAVGVDMSRSVKE